MRYVTKTALGSIKITNDNSVIISLKSSNGQSCLYFESIEKFAEAVRKKLIRAKRWIVSVPDNLCISKTVELPAEGLEQAYKMLEFELSTYLPLPVEELVYGCVPLGKNGNILKISVYILKIKTLDSLLARLKSIGIIPSRIMIDSVAVGSWFNHKKESDAAEINLLFDSEHLLLLAVKENNLQRYEQVPLANTNIEDKREYITDQVKHLAAESCHDKQPVLKIASTSDIREKIKDWFTANFGSIEFLKPPILKIFGKKESSEKDHTYESVITQGLLNAAENPQYKFLNLLGGKTLNVAKRRRLVLNTAVTVLFGVLAVFCLWLNFAAVNWRIHHACQKITKEIAPIKHIAADVESKRQKVKAIQTQLSNRDQISEIFSQLYQYSPKEIAISQMSYSSKADTASFNIKGQADTLSRAFEYSNAMKNSSLLNNIQIINAQQIPRPGGSIVEFKADCSIKENKTR
jgi:Tfp pilus assembly protein PilN